MSIYKIVEALDDSVFSDLNPEDIPEDCLSDENE